MKKQAKPKPRSIAQTLQQAMERISHPRWWCKHSYAKDKKGKDISATSPDAVRFCSSGAIDSVTYNQKLRAGAFDLLNNQAIASHRYGIITLNDKDDHATVMKVFRSAIRLAKKKAAKKKGQK